MISIFDISFWLYFFIFFIAIFLAFFIPGDLLLMRLNLSLFQRIILGTIVGMGLWAWQGFIFGYAGVRWFTHLYLIITFLLWLKLNFKKYSFSIIPKLNPKDFDWLLIIIITIGVLFQLSSVWFNGVYIKEGLFFCCSNLFDSILHTALTNQIVKDIPPYEPGMYGEIVRNYHYWGNMMVGELIRVFRLPLIPTQNQYSMLLISVLLGLSGVVIGQITGLGRSFYRWLAFFLYMGGDLIFFLVSFIRKEVNFQMGSLEDGAKFLVNPPRAFSIIIFFAGISLMILWLKKREWRVGLLVAMLFGSLIVFKVYTGLFALIGFIFLGGYFLVKKQLRMVLIAVITFVISLIVYLPVNSNAGGLYFTGFSLFENFIVQPWMMLDRLELARRIYLEHHSWLRVVQYESFFAFIFIVTVFGTKLIGLFQTRKSLSILPIELHIFLISGMAVSAILGFFFQQYTGGPNTFNFLVSVFIIGSIYTALACSYWMKKLKYNAKIFLIIFIVIITAGRVFQTAFVNVHNIQAKKGFIVENYELSGLRYLKEKTKKDSLILVDYRAFKTDAESPYISFLADRPMFLSGLGNELKAHGIDFSDRKEVVDTILTSHDPKVISENLLKHKISYLYLSALDNKLATEASRFSKTVFQNQRIRILEMAKNNKRQ